jgi:hypothetical protein
MSIDVMTTDKTEPTAEEVEKFHRDSLIIPTGEIDPNDFPRLSNMSAGFLYQAIIRPQVPERPEYVALRMGHDALEMASAVGMWNMVWESAQIRRRYFDMDNLPKPMQRIADLGDVNVSFVARTKSRYFEYAPLVHLLPQATLERFGIPLLRAGTWPYMGDRGGLDRYLPTDFEQRLSRAWAATVWPHLISGSPMRAFSKDDPIRLLSHNLDFWIPAVTEVVQSILREFPIVEKGVKERPVTLMDGGTLEGAVAGNPRMGGDIWRGVAEAAEAMADTVEAADQTGRLRDIIDAVRSNRVEDDFSEQWSFAREDFERKLFKKRSKASVRFVEMTDTIPVQGPESDIVGQIVTNDFLALLDDKNRQIVVLLNSGVTKKVEIAKALGYANHSAVSKRLAQIRKAAAEHFRD